MATHSGPPGLHTHTQDMAQTELFTPLFGGVARLSQMIRTVSLTGDVEPARTCRPHRSYGSGTCRQTGIGRSRAAAEPSRPV